MKALLDRLRKNKFVQGGAILTLAHYSASFLNYLFNSFAGKALGPDGFSEIAALFAYVNIFSIPMVIITTIIIRRLGHAGSQRNAVGKTFEKWFWMKSKRWLYFVPFVYISVFFLPAITNLSTMSSFTLVSLIILNLCAVLYISLLQGMHLFLQFSVATLLIAGFKFAGALGAYFEVGHLNFVYSCVIAGTLMPILYGKFALSKITIPSKSTYSFEKNIRHILFQKQVIITALSLLSITMLGNLDIIYAKKIFSPEDAGLYSAWSLFAKIILYFIGPLNMISLIFFSAKETAHHRKKTMYSFLGLFSLAGIAMYVLYVVFGHSLIGLIFNEKFNAIYPLLGQAAIFGILYTFITIINNYFLSQNDRRSLIAVISVPFYMGGLILFGSSIDTLISVNIWVAAVLFGVYFLNFLRE